MLWFTGLSGAGKSTLAQALAAALSVRKQRAYVLDGDELRRGLCKDLGFSEDARRENIRRAAEVARMFADAGLICIVALISPLRSARADAKRRIGRHRFFEVYVAADLATCEKRDVKGLYRRARAGQVRQFTGLASPYEPPRRPTLVLDTAKLSVSECVDKLMALCCKGGRL